MRVCDAAVIVLKRTDNPAVMWGDEGLLCEIGVEAGMKSGKGRRPTEFTTRVLNALSRQPGTLKPGYALNGQGRRVRIFRLPDGNPPAQPT